MVLIIKTKGKCMSSYNKGVCHHLSSIKVDLLPLV